MDALLRDTALLAAYCEDASDDSNILAYLGEPYEESFSDTMNAVMGRVSAAIQKIIEKIKEMYKDVRERLEIAKIKAILNAKGAKSSIMIKFHFRDKEITKYVNQLIKLSNVVTVEGKKIEQQFLRGRITFEEAGSQINEVTEKFFSEVEDVENSWDGKIAQEKIGDANTSYTAQRITEYLKKLTNYQEQVLTAACKNILAEEDRLLKEAKELEKLAAKKKKEEEEAAKAAAEEAAKVSKGEKASFKSKLAAAYAKVNKKMVAAIVSIIAITATVCHFGSQYKSAPADTTESVDDIDDLFDDLTDYSESWDDDYDGYDSSLEDLFAYI